MIYIIIPYKTETVLSNYQHTLDKQFNIIQGLNLFMKEKLQVLIKWHLLNCYWYQYTYPDVRVWLSANVS